MTPLDGYSMYYTNNMVQVGISKSQPRQATELDEAYLQINVCSNCPRAESSKRNKSYRYCPSCRRKVRLSSRLDAELERVLLHMVILSADQVEENPHSSPLVLTRVDVLCLCYTIGDRLSLENAIHKVGGCLPGTGSQLTPFWLAVVSSSSVLLSSIARYSFRIGPKDGLAVERRKLRGGYTRRSNHD